MLRFYGAFHLDNAYAQQAMWMLTWAPAVFAVVDFFASDVALTAESDIKKNPTIPSDVQQE